MDKLTKAERERKKISNLSTGKILSKPIFQLSLLKTFLYKPLESLRKKD